MSLKPGIGEKFYEKFKTDFFPSDESPVPGKGIINKVPRYYQKILEKESPEILADVLRSRADFISSHRADFTPERLMDKYRCAQARLMQKQRNL